MALRVKSHGKEQIGGRYHCGLDSEKPSGVTAGLLACAQALLLTTLYANIMGGVNCAGWGWGQTHDGYSSELLRARSGNITPVNCLTDGVINAITSPPFGLRMGVVCNVIEVLPVWRCKRSTRAGTQ